MDKFHEVGNISLRWLGQMGFLIETGKYRICIDYYASPDDLRQTPVPIPAEELKNVDVFLGTHDHLDHIDHEAWKIWAKTNPDAKFVFPAADFAGEIEPHFVIPGHWDMFADNSSDPNAFEDYIDAKYGGKIGCIIPKIMERITIRN